jgi:hypothetical protein
LAVEKKDVIFLDIGHPSKGITIKTVEKALSKVSTIDATLRKSAEPAASSSQKPRIPRWGCLTLRFESERYRRVIKTSNE